MAADPPAGLTADFDPAGRRLLVACNRRWQVFDWPALTPVGGTEGWAEFAAIDTAGTHVWATAHGFGPEPAVVHRHDAAIGQRVKSAVVGGRNGWAWWGATPDR